jgi:transposase
VHLAEPAETAARRGNEKRAKNDRADARHLRELLMAGRLPESWIPPDHILDLAGRSLDNMQVLERLKRRLARQSPSVLLRICRELLARIRELTVQVRALERDLRPLVARHAPALLALPGVGTINATRLLAEVADVSRFKTEAQLALYAGVAPLDASSGRQLRHRLNRSGNRQLNAALRMIALTQARVHAPAREYIARRRREGKTGRDAIRALKRDLIRTLYRLLSACAEPRPAIEIPTHRADPASHRSDFASAAARLRAETNGIRAQSQCRGVAVADPGGS